MPIASGFSCLFVTAATQFLHRIPYSFLLWGLTLFKKVPLINLLRWHYLQYYKEGEVHHAAQGDLPLSHFLSWNLYLQYPLTFFFAILGSGGNFCNALPISVSVKYPSALIIPLISLNSILHCSQYSSFS